MASIPRCPWTRTRFFLRRERGPLRHQSSNDPERRPQGIENRQIDRTWRPYEHRRPVGLTPVPAGRDHLALLVAAPRPSPAPGEVARHAPAPEHAVPRALTVQARDLRSRSTTRAAARSECRAPEAPEKSIASQGSHARRSRRGTVLWSVALSPGWCRRWSPIARTRLLRRGR